MLSELPDTLLHYFAAQNRHDIEGMLDAFASGAEVKDEGRTYNGRVSIRGWKVETSSKYRANAQPLKSHRNRNTLTTIVRVSGAFHGTPVELSYNFLLDPSGLIRRLEIS